MYFPTRGFCPSRPSGLLALPIPEYRGKLSGEPPPLLPGPWSGQGEPAQHELGVFVHIMGGQVTKQRPHDVSQILKLAVQCQGQQRSHVAAVPLGEAGLLLQGADELGRHRRVLALTLGSSRPPRPPTTVTLPASGLACAQLHLLAPRGPLPACVALTVRRKSLLLSRLESCVRPWHRGARRPSSPGPSNMGCSGQLPCPGKKTRSAYVR